MRSDGAGLTAGNGSVAPVQAIYQARCLACDGEKGKKGTPATGATVLTVGSYRPYATTLYDNIHRAMPVDSPQSLTPSEVHPVATCTLHLNGIVKADAVLAAAAPGAIQMLYRAGCRPVLK